MIHTPTSPFIHIFILPCLHTSIPSYSILPCLHTSIPSHFILPCTRSFILHTAISPYFHSFMLSYSICPCFRTAGAGVHKHGSHDQAADRDTDSKPHPPFWSGSHQTGQTIQRNKINQFFFNCVLFTTTMFYSIVDIKLQTI